MRVQQELRARLSRGAPSQVRAGAGDGCEARALPDRAAAAVSSCLTKLPVPERERRAPVPVPVPCERETRRGAAAARFVPRQLSNSRSRSRGQAGRPAGAQSGATVAITKVALLLQLGVAALRLAPMAALKAALARRGHAAPPAPRRRWPAACSSTTAATAAAAAAHAACQHAQPGCVSRRDASLLPVVPPASAGLWWCRRRCLALVGLAASSLLADPGRPRADAAVQAPPAAAAAAPAAPAAWQQQAFELSLPSGSVLADVWGPDPTRGASPSAASPARLLVFSPGFLVDRAAYSSLYSALAREGWGAGARSRPWPPPPTLLVPRPAAGPAQRAAARP
jgi:hypothetical protein